MWYDSVFQNFVAGRRVNVTPDAYHRDREDLSHQIKSNLSRRENKYEPFESRSIRRTEKFLFSVR
jgi:hypothetical protein